MAGTASHGTASAVIARLRSIDHRALPPHAIQRRRHSRIVYREPVCVSAIGEPHRCWYLLAEDLSLGGLCLLSAEPHAVGSRLLLGLEPDTAMAPIRVMAEVRWMARVDFQERYRIGIQFEEPSDAARHDLRQLVHQHKRGQRTA